MNPNDGRTDDKAECDVCEGVTTYDHRLTSHRATLVPRGDLLIHADEMIACTIGPFMCVRLSGFMHMHDIHVLKISHNCRSENINLYSILVYCRLTQ